MKKALSQYIQLCLMSWLILIPVANASAEMITVGIVKDGDSYFDEIIPLIEGEVQKHIEAPQTIDFKISEEFNAQWNRKQARSALEAALNDPAIDYVLVTLSIPFVFKVH